MSVGSGLYAGEINCLVSRLVIVVPWLGIFARYDLPDVTCEIRPWFFILNINPKHLTETHWLALYAPIVGRIKLCY